MNWTSSQRLSLSWQYFQTKRKAITKCSLTLFLIATTMLPRRRLWSCSACLTRLSLRTCPLSKLLRRTRTYPAPWLRCDKSEEPTSMHSTRTHSLKNTSLRRRSQSKRRQMRRVYSPRSRSLTTHQHMTSCEARWRPWSRVSLRPWGRLFKTHWLTR